MHHWMGCVSRRTEICFSGSVDPVIWKVPRILNFSLLNKIRHAKACTQALKLIAFANISPEFELTNFVNQNFDLVVRSTAGRNNSSRIWMFPFFAHVQKHKRSLTVGYLVSASPRGGINIQVTHLTCSSVLHSSPPNKTNADLCVLTTEPNFRCRFLRNVSFFELSCFAYSIRNWTRQLSYDELLNEHQDFWQKNFLMTVSWKINIGIGKSTNSPLFEKASGESWKTDLLNQLASQHWSWCDNFDLID